MAEILLLNPKKRGGARRKWGSPAQRAALRKMLAANRARKGRGGGGSRKRRAARRSNPSPLSTYRRKSRSYSTRRASRRRRNPINLRGAFNPRGYFTLIREAAVQGAGAVAMDVGYAYLSRWLPAMLQRVPGQVGVGDAAKAIITVFLGRALSGITRGLSNKAALGALTVQARDIVASLLPPTIPVAGLGYVTSGVVVPGSGRVGWTRAGGGMGAYVGGPSPLLMARNPGGIVNAGTMGAYVGGPTPLLARAPGHGRR